MLRRTLAVLLLGTLALAGFVAAADDPAPAAPSGPPVASKADASTDSENPADAEAPGARSQKPESSEHATEKPEATEQPETPAKREPVTGPEASAARAEFDTAYAAFRQNLGQLRTLSGRYQISRSTQKTQIVDEFNRLLPPTEVLATRMVAAAKALYPFDPDNREVGDLLMLLLAEAIDGDHYERAAPLAKLLADSGTADKRLPNMLGLNAFGNNDFVTARNEWIKAMRANIIDKPAQRRMAQCDALIPMWQAEQKVRAAEAEADDLPRVKFTTTKGDIVLELFENEAPNSTANFISLVEKHFYDGLTFHRVIADFVAQGGDPEGNGKGGPGYSIACECYAPNHRNHFAGSLSMAHGGRDSGGSQFFITLAPTPELNGKHTVFGRVIEGQDVVSNLERTEPVRPAEVDKILSATVLRKRDHAYEPVTKPQVTAPPS